MVKRLLTLIVALTLGTGLGVLTGCGDDIQRTTIETTEQSTDPEPVAPGEPVVE